MERMPARLRSRGLLVATHADLLANARDSEKLLTRLRSECDALFRDVVMVSTLNALALLRADELAPAEAAWQATGADALDAALSALLLSVRDQRAQSALGVTGRIAHRALSSNREIADGAFRNKLGRFSHRGCVARGRGLG